MDMLMKERPELVELWNKPGFKGSAEHKKLEKMLASALVDDDDEDDDPRPVGDAIGQAKTCWKCGNLERPGVSLRDRSKFLKCPKCKI